ncbi:MAG: flagellar protein FliS [Oscillospiraceae bacterium]|nr:flagellar protein FliS [Oscillospiraceae bacterium]
MNELENIKRYKTTELSTLPTSELYIKMYEFLLQKLRLSYQALTKNDMVLFYNSITKADKMLAILIEMFTMADETESAAIDEFITIYISLEKKIGEVLHKKDQELLLKIISMIEKLKNMWQGVIDTMDDK